MLCSISYNSICSYYYTVITLSQIILFIAALCLKCWVTYLALCVDKQNKCKYLILRNFLININTQKMYVWPYFYQCALNFHIDNQKCLKCKCYNHTRNTEIN